MTKGRRCTNGRPGFPYLQKDFGRACDNHGSCLLHKGTPWFPLPSKRFWPGLQQSRVVSPAPKEDKQDDTRNNKRACRHTTLFASDSIVICNNQGPCLVDEGTPLHEGTPWFPLPSKRFWPGLQQSRVVSPVQRVVRRRQRRQTG